VGLDGLLEQPLGLGPGPPCRLSHPTGIAPSLCALRHFGLSLRHGLKLPLGLPPLRSQKSPEPDSLTQTQAPRRARGGTRLMLGLGNLLSGRPRLPQRRVCRAKALLVSP